MHTKLHDANNTKKDHQLATYVTQAQYRAVAERAWRARMKVGAYLRERLDAAGEFEMPTEAEEPARDEAKEDDGSDDVALLHSHFDEEAVLDLLAD